MLRPPSDRAAGDALALHAALGALACLAVSVIWAATGFGTFWPGYVWTGIGAGLGLDVLARRHLARAEGPDRWLSSETEGAVVIGAVCTAIWLLAGAGSFWPAWVIGALALLLGVQTIISRQVVLPSRLERALSARVDTLERTRRGALDVQSEQLRRIERDLHDGAQSRLVALSMKIGRAEARLDEDSDTAALLREAREDATAAIAELRDLARGIAPPVLTDRGLAAAVATLGERAPGPVDVIVTLGQRPPSVVETAAYFVVCEGLANVAKHAQGAAATVRIAERGGELVVAVADDGPGGANPRASGLMGLRHRVEALDGLLNVTSPQGGPTILEAVIPCAW